MLRFCEKTPAWINKSSLPADTKTEHVKERTIAKTNIPDRDLVRGDLIALKHNNICRIVIDHSDSSAELSSFGSDGVVVVMAAMQFSAQSPMGTYTPQASSRSPGPGLEVQFALMYVRPALTACIKPCWCHHSCEERTYRWHTSHLTAGSAIRSVDPAISLRTSDSRPHHGGKEEPLSVPSHWAAGCTATPTRTSTWATDQIADSTLSPRW